MVSLRPSLARRLTTAVVLTALSALLLSLAPAQSSAKTLRHGATDLTVEAPSDFRLRYQPATRTYALLSRERRIRITYSRIRTDASLASVRRLMAPPARAAGSRQLRLEVRRKGPQTVAATILGYRRASERRRRALAKIQRRVTRTARGGRTVKVDNSRERPVVVDDAPDNQLADGLLFEDTFDLGEAGESIWGPKQAAAGSLDYVSGQAFPGRRLAMRNRLVPGDTHAGTDSARSELTGSLRFRDGDVRWFRMPVRFNQWAQSSAWALIWQAHAGSGSPPLATYIEGDQQTFHVKNGNTMDTFWKHPFELGRWYDLVIGVRFSHGGDGWVEVWLDGKQQTMANGATRMAGATLSPRSDDSYDKLGLYQSKSFSAGERELLHGMYRVGTSHASVMR